MTDEGEEINVTKSFSPLLTLDEFCKEIDDYIEQLKQGESTSAEKTNSFVMGLPRGIIKFALWFVKFLDYHNGLSKKIIDSLPFFSTIFLTNLGSVGMDAVFHHNFEIGNCGLFWAIGKIKKINTLKKDGTVETHDIIKIKATYDDRITDGIYCARGFDMARDFIENPEKLEEPFELTPEQISNLGLAESEY